MLFKKGMLSWRPGMDSNAVSLPKHRYATTTRRSIMIQAWTRWQDWVKVGLGAWLFVAHWVLGTAANAASSWNAWLLGIGIIAVALWALAQLEAIVVEHTNIALAVWLFIAPWVLGFAALAAATGNAWITAAIVGGLPLAAVPTARQGTPSR
jgi:hypothetical protein